MTLYRHTRRTVVATVAGLATTTLTGCTGGNAAEATSTPTLTGSPLLSGTGSSPGGTATDGASLRVDVSREDATLVHRIAVVAPGEALRLRLDGAFGIYAVTETDGFVADGGGYRLERGRDRGSLTALLDLSDPRETALGSVGPGGAYRAGADWAFAPSPRVHVRWLAPGERVRHLRLTEESTVSDTATETYAPDGAGGTHVPDAATDPDEGAVTLTASTTLTVGERFVFLGPHSVERRTVDGQQVRVVVPAGTAFAVGVDRAAALLRAVQKQTGTRVDGPITTFVLPEQARDGGASSGADVWVRADVGEVTVAHEFVHASLSLRTTTETRWLREAAAEYLAYRVAGEPGAVDSLDVTGAYEDATLTDPATWEHWRVPYDRGAATLAALDARLRNATDGKVTVARLVGRLSTASQSTGSGPLTHDRFVEAVRDAGGDESARWVDAAVSNPDGGRNENSSRRSNAIENSTERSPSVAVSTPTGV